MAIYTMEPNKVARKLVIVEGTNYSGKSRLFDVLRREIPGSTIIELHDYYNNQAKRLQEAGAKITVDQICTGEFGIEIKNELVDYNFERICSAVRQVRREIYDHFLFERLHGTDFVYRGLLFGDSDFEKYSVIERSLNELDARLLVLSVDDETMKHRMESTSKMERKGPLGGALPIHLTDYDELRRKRDGYEDFYQRSQIKHKLLVRSTNQTDYSACLTNLLNGCTPYSFGPNRVDMTLKRHARDC